MIIYELICKTEYNGEHRTLFRRESDAISEMHKWVKEVTVNMNECIRVNEVTKHAIDVEWVDDYPVEYDDDTVLYCWARIIRREVY